jgi:hypothetical protein
MSPHTLNQNEPLDDSLLSCMAPGMREKVLPFSIDISFLERVFTDGDYLTRFKHQA